MKCKDAIPLFCLALIWGAYYVVSQQAVALLSVFTVGILIRFLTMILLTIRMAAKHELKSLLAVKGELLRLLLIGVMGFLLDLTAFIGLSLSPAGAGTALLKTDILFVNLISVVVYHQKFSKKEWLFSLIMLGGVFLVMGVDFHHFSLGGPGSIFFILSALFVSINAFLIKSAQRSKKVKLSNDVIAYYNNFVTMLLFFAASAVMGTLGQLQSFGTNPTVTFWAVLAGVGQTGIYIVYYYNLAKFPVWLVKVVLLLMPVVAAGISFALFGETLSGQQCAGVLVVMLGAAGILLEQRKKESGQISASM